MDLAARTVRWRVLLARSPRPGYIATFRYLVIGYLANNLLPARVGELLRAHLLGTREGVGTSRALASIALERTLDVASASTIGFMALTIARVGGVSLAGFALLSLASVAAVLLLTLAPHRWIREAIDRFAGRATLRPVVLGLPKVSSFVNGILDAASPGALWPGLGLSLLAWLSTAAVFYVAAQALGINLPLAVIVAIAMAANLGSAIPSAPAGVGPFEFAVVFIATGAGLDPSSALLLGVLSHAMTVVPVVLLGAVSIPFAGGLVNLDLRRRPAVPTQVSAR